MDYKKFIIINLAFLIIYGKLLKFIFEKIQKGLNFIKIENYTGINIFYKKSLLVGIIFEDKNFEIKEMQNFYSNLRNLVIVNDLTIEKINAINEYCVTTKTLKIKIFIFSIFMFIIVNYIVYREFISWKNLNKIKEKIKSILKKLEKINSANI
jgi:hypothetical protein